MNFKNSRLQKSFTLIELMLVIAIIGILSALVIPNMLESRKLANEAAAISTILTIHSAQVIYRERNPFGYHGNLTDLGNANLVEELLTDGRKSGYTFEVRPGSSVTNAGGRPGDEGYLYFIQASPTAPGQSGNRYFYSDQTGIILLNFDRQLSVADDIPSATQPFGKR